MRNWVELINNKFEFLARSNNRKFFERSRLNFFEKWWMDIDGINFCIILSIILFGIVAVLSSSSAVAQKINVDHFHFVKKQAVFAVMTLIVIVILSNFNIEFIKIFAIAMFFVCLLLLVAVLFLGQEVKGARRWLYIYQFSLQPAEISKPIFAVINAIILSDKNINIARKYLISAGMIAFVFMLVIAEPDFGMSIIFVALWVVGIFLSGLAFIWFILFGFVGIAGSVVIYNALPHVRERVHHFLDPSGAYQINKALEAYNSGGLFGLGLGNGVIKRYIPDSHTDFIIAVMAEEFGIISIIFVATIFFIFTLRVFFRILNQKDEFVYIAGGSLAVHLILQFLINMSVSMKFIPTTGITASFISYGGSGLIGCGISAGIILAITKRRYEEYGEKKRNLLWKI